MPAGDHKLPTLSQKRAINVALRPPPAETPGRFGVPFQNDEERGEGRSPIGTAPGAVLCASDTSSHSVLTRPQEPFAEQRCAEPPVLCWVSSQIPRIRRWARTPRLPRASLLVGAILPILQVRKSGCRAGKPHP